MGQGRSQIAPFSSDQAPEVVPIEISQPQVSSDDQLKARRQPQKEPVIYEANIPRKPIILDIDHGVVCSQPLNAMSGTNPPGVDSAKRGGETDNVDGGRAKRKSKGDHIYYHARLVSRKEQGSLCEADSHKLHKVVACPRKDRGKKLHFVVSKGGDGLYPETNRPTSTLPQGKGYQWPDSFSSRSFKIIFPGEGSEGDQLVSTAGSDINILSSDSNNGILRLSVRANSTAQDVTAQLALHFLQRADQFLLYAGQSSEPISGSMVISNLSEVSAGGTWENFLIDLEEI